jgi:hypothetical protein
VPGESNYVLLVADSARYDTAVRARASFLRRCGSFRQAWAPGTFTWPSHMAMMVGMLPHCFEDEPLYNRYRQHLWRLGTGGGGGAGSNRLEPVVRLPSDESIVDGFRKLGYATIGTGGLEWFRHPIWSAWFEEFALLGRADEQHAWVLERIARGDGRPFFAFVNYRETHEPYSYGSESFELPDGFFMHKLGRGPLTAEEFATLHERQIAAFDYLDGQIESFCARLPDDTLVVLTGDHGDCFGEDGFYGHGFYHPKVMEVPLLIFRVSDAR